MYNQKELLSIKLKGKLSPVYNEGKLLLSAMKLMDMNDESIYGYDEGNGIREYRVHNVPSCGFCGEAWNPIEFDQDAFPLLVKTYKKATHDQWSSLRHALAKGSPKDVRLAATIAAYEIVNGINTGPGA